MYRLYKNSEYRKNIILNSCLAVKLEADENSENM